MGGWILSSSGDGLAEHFHSHAVSDRPILLLLDGHSSHYQPELISFAKQYEVILFCLPPHTIMKANHWMQAPTNL